MICVYFPRKEVPMKIIIRFFCLFLISVMLCSCFSGHTDSSTSEASPLLPTEEIPASEPSYSPDAVLSLPEQLLSDMTLQEKVGQLFLIRPESLFFDNTPVDILYSYATGGITEVSEGLCLALSQYPVGGFILFSQNITDPDQVTRFNSQLEDACAIPPFLAVDEEGGAVARLANHSNFDLPRYSSAYDVCLEGSVAAAQDMGLEIGGYLSLYGFNMDMAPDADVFTNPANTVIGHRAFSSDPREAAACARAMADGLRQRGICPVFKHFPGHGDTAEDSHRQIAVSRKNQEQLEACEWIPFLEAEDRECVMVGHIALPELTGSNVPATLSPRIIQDILRDNIGFQGLILTDSLSMGAITAFYDPDLAPLMALEAGCYVLMMVVYV